MRKRAFEPFFTTKPAGAGTSLGLSMVHGFVKQSGGHIKIHSERRRGTSVRIFLSWAESAEAPLEPGSGASDESDILGGSETILVVEADARPTGSGGLAWRVQNKKRIGPLLDR